MSILELATRYHNRVGGGPGYLHQLTVLARRLPWKVQQVTPDLIDEYLTKALVHLAPSTVHRHRRMLACLLRFAHSEGLLDRSTVLRSLRRVKVPAPNPRAWSHAEIARLLAVAAVERGGTRYCPYSLLLPAWIRAAYCTGLRRCDLLALRHDDLRGNRACVMQDKTDWPHVIVFDDEALQSIHRLPRNGPRIFGDLISEVQIVRILRRVVKRAGLTGTGKFLRRAGATYCEIANQDSSRYLGHKSPGMKTYYVDRLLLAQARQHQPPPPLPKS
jgi:integrase